MNVSARILLGCSVILSCSVISGCTTFEQLQAPETKIPGSWHATLPHDGRTADLLSWWSGFSDPSLTALIGFAEAESPTLASSAADIRKARATLASSQANMIPQLDGSASVSRSGTEGDAENRVAVSTTSSGALDASWEIDLFGKDRLTSKADRIRVQKQIANWHDARVSLAAEVADYYVQYKSCRLLEQAYAAELSSQRETIRATQTSATSGFTSNADLALAKASAASSSSSLTGQKAECEILIKSLAQVTGGDEERVRSLLARGKSKIPTPKAFRVISVPAEALRQRPDIDALELELAAAIADVGAAKADLYPSLSMSGSITISQSTLTGKSLPWSFGPALSIPLFDGGSRRAAVESKAADYDSAVASYKSGVLSAINDIETALVRLDSTRRKIGDATTAAENYRTYFNSIDSNWKAGGASLLNREEARRSAQSAEITLIETRRDAVRYWIALYKALGGGWNAEAAPPQPVKSE
jgi:outer membrane protein, multidrug efflux system